MSTPGVANKSSPKSPRPGQFDRFAAGAKTLSTSIAVSTSQVGARVLGTLATVASGRVASSRVASNRVASSRVPSSRKVTAKVDHKVNQKSFIALAGMAGAETARRGFDLAEATVRLATGDPTAFRREFDEQLSQLQLLADSDEMGDLLPVPLLDSQLCDEARQLVARAPNRLLKAMERAPGRQGESILGAAVLDARELGGFAVAYPRFLAKVGTNIGKLLASGTISFPDIEAFIEGRRRAASAISASEENHE